MELGREVVAGGDTVDVEVGSDFQTVQVETAVVVVHPDQDATEWTVRPGLRRRQRQDRAVVIEHPAEAASLGRTLATHEIVIRDDEGRRLSTVRMTNMLRDQ